MIRRREFTAGLATVALCAATVPAAAVTAPSQFETDFIVPDIRFPDAVRQTVHENTITLHYTYMTRWRKRHGDDAITIESAKVGSERYAQWLAEQTDPKPYPPHIQFGGGVAPNPKGDPKFYDRWVAYASTLT
jgi:hypothetical protein